MMWGIIVGICLIGVIALAVMAIGEDKLNSRRYRERIARMFAERATKQNDSALRGEPYGTYGEYMPPKDLQ